MFLKPLPLGPSACVHLNPGLLPPSLVMSPHSPLALRSEPRGGWGAIQYYFHFRYGIEKVSLDLLNPEIHQLPSDFPTSILRYEGWAEPEDLFQIAPPPRSDPFPVISVSCPKSSTYGSPDHGLTFCNGAAFAQQATSYGPSLAIPDWHHQYSETTGLWTAVACHTPDCGPIALAYHLTTRYWASHPVDSLSIDNFATPVTAAFTTLINSNRHGVPAHSLPPHTLFSTTARLLLSIFAGFDLLVEGFGPGAYAGAVISNLAFTYSRFKAMLVSLGGIAMHVPTFVTCLNHFKAHHLHIEEKYATYTAAQKQIVSRRPAGPLPPQNSYSS